MSKSRILVVEDEVIVAMDIQAKLKDLGYDVPCIISSGEEAVKRVHEIQPDLVMMDISLEGEMDGIEAARNIRSQVNIPVIYLTAYSDDKTLQRAKITLPFGYILKPFRERDLQATIEMALYRHRIEQRLFSLEKLAALGTLAADVVQKLADPVQSALRLANQALQHPPAEAKEALTPIREDLIKLESLVKDLIYFQELSNQQDAFTAQNQGPLETTYSGQALVIENEAHLGLLAEAYLVQMGLKTQVRTDSLAGWRALQDNEYDLILVDMDLPGLDGRSFYQRVAANLPAACSRIVFVLGDPRTPDNRIFLQETGNAYIPKPFTFQDVLKAVDAVMA